MIAAINIISDAWSEGRRRKKRQHCLGCWLLFFSMAVVLMGMTGRFVAFNSPRLLASSSSSDCHTSRRRKRVVIVGAGAAGLTAAKRLVRGFHDDGDNGATSHCPSSPEVRILEASSGFGGRVQKDTTNFADYPLDLGASWVNDGMKRIPLFAQNDTLKKFLEHKMITPSVDKDVNFQSYHILRDGRHKDFTLGKDQSLWVDYSWYDFLKDHIVAPTLRDHHFVYNCQVDRILQLEDDENQILVACGKQEFVADHVIVTVPLQILQDGDINFYPPIKRQRQLFESKMWQGFKIFFEFSKTFYYDAFEWWVDDGELDFWDYSLVHQSHTHKNIIAGYFVGDAAAKFRGLTDDQIAKKVLNFLDKTYGQEQATHYFKRYMIVNWSNNPFIRGIYSNVALRMDKEKRGGPQSLWSNSKNKQLLVAGEAFPVPPKHNGWVDGAALSGLHAAELILHDIDPERLVFSIPNDLLGKD